MLHSSSNILIKIVSSTVSVNGDEINVYTKQFHNKLINTNYNYNNLGWVIKN